MNSNEDEKFEYIGRVLYDNLGDKSTCRNKNVIYGLDKFTNCLERTNEELQEYWC